MATPYSKLPLDGLTVDRRAQIAAAAAVLFAEYGYEATSVRQIADRVGMLPGSLYNHFATKDDMLHEVMRARMEQLERDNLRVAQLPANAEHRLLANAIMRIHHYVEHWQFHTILFHEGPFFQRHQDFAYVVHGKSRISAVQASILREGMEAGLFRPDMDAYLMIGTISRMLSGVTRWHRSSDMLSSDQPSRYNLDQLVDFHFDCVLRLVRVPARLAEPVPRAFCERLLSAQAARL
jgi:AcrR family transcriptional regulator